MKFPFRKNGAQKFNYPTDGILIGSSDDRSRTPFYVAPDALQYHSLIHWQIGRRQNQSDQASGDGGDGARYVAGRDRYRRRPGAIIA